MAHDIQGVHALSLPFTAESHDLRLRLAPGLNRRGALDGGWWPRSHDAATELAVLLDGLAAPLGEITRLTVDAKDWERIPRRITVGDRVVKVGWFPNLDHMIIVTRRQDEFLLLVVPPTAAEDAAHRALDQAAAGTTGSDRPTTILAACDIDTTRPPATSPHWAEGDRPALRLVPVEAPGEHRQDD
ncbi:MAG TPA: DUF5994 family protein [Streptosporangiaceae bacterium]|nr:DUF5994 family protein [Streptosporangiaceae bacterium]